MCTDQAARVRRPRLRTHQDEKKGIFFVWIHPLAATLALHVNAALCRVGSEHPLRFFSAK